MMKPLIKLQSALGIALMLLMSALPSSADSLSYTNQHVIVKDDEQARRNRPEKAEKPIVQLGNFRIEVPALVAASPLSVANFASASMADGARSKPRNALFQLTMGRSLTASDERRFKEMVSDGEAEVWAPKDAHAYVSTLMPSAALNGEPTLRAWLPCDQGCENWLWIERRGEQQ